MTERKRVLIVDDQRPVAEMLLAVLQDEGFEARVCIDAECALPRALTFDPHLIVLDLVMPGRSGGEVLHELRQAPETARTPVLVMTAYHSAAEEIQSRSEEGPTELLEKPFDVDEFVQRAHRMVANSANAAPGTAEVNG